MAVLNNAQLTALRRRVAFEFKKRGLPIAYDKPTANTVFQAIEDWFEDGTGAASQAGKIQISSVINNATAFSFTVDERILIGGVYLELKAGVMMDGVV